MPGVLPFFAFNVGRQSLQAHHRVAPVLWTIVIANVVNLGLNEALIFGKFGFPELGVAGSAWATTVSRLLMVPLLLAFARRELMPTIRPWLPASTQRGPVLAMLRLGCQRRPGRTRDDAFLQWR